MLVAASTAALAAHAFASHGGRTDRSARDVAWMALTTYHVGARTGYSGVKVLPPGAFVRLERGSPTVVQTHPTGPIPSERQPPLDELAERARADIRSTLEAARSHPSASHVIRLTGGKDSRLVLAVAVWAGAARSWQYETIGPPRLADVQVATELATDFGLDHDVRFVGLAPSTPYADRARQFVARTAGMVNVWDLDNANESDAVVVTGICGEILRSIVRADPPPRSQQDVLDLFSLKRLGRSQLVLPEVLADLHRALVQDLLEPSPARDRSPVRAPCPLPPEPAQVLPSRSPRGTPRPDQDPASLRTDGHTVRVHPSSSRSPGRGPRTPDHRDERTLAGISPVRRDVLANQRAADQRAADHHHAGTGSGPRGEVAHGHPPPRPTR